MKSKLVVNFDQSKPVNTHPGNSQHAPP